MNASFGSASPTRPLSIAVIGQGIAGMSAAWLLSQRHKVTVYEAEPRFGGHSHTVEAPGPAGPIPVDMGFIVYNAANYPNFTALLAHLGAPTAFTDMSFGVSLDDGDLEYASTDLGTLFAQPRNLLRPRFWSMLKDLVRFSRQAPAHACALDARMTSLGDYLGEAGYGRPFQDDHLLPQAAAIWSASVEAARELPAAAFIRFFENHGLLKILDKPLWRTVVGGSREYVRRLTAPLADARLGVAATRVVRTPAGVLVTGADGRTERYDHVVIACHANEGLRLLAQPTAAERQILGAFSYTQNLAVLHSDASFMPQRRRAWSSWNYLGQTRADGAGRALCVTYWMNLLQDLPREAPLFVTLNPVREPDPVLTIRTEMYSHPLFDAAALRAQKRLWSVQGEGGVWWAGAYCGAGFHEDGLQAGLAVAEAIGGVRRPWRVANESGRIFLGPTAVDAAALEQAA